MVSRNRRASTGRSWLVATAIGAWPPPRARPIAGLDRTRRRGARAVGEILEPAGGGSPRRVIEREVVREVEVPVSANGGDDEGTDYDARVLYNGIRLEAKIDKQDGTAASAETAEGRKLRREPDPARARAETSDHAGGSGSRAERHHKHPAGPGRHGAGGQGFAVLCKTLRQQGGAVATRPAAAQQAALPPQLLRLRDHPRDAASGKPAPGSPPASRNGRRERWLRWRPPAGNAPGHRGFRLLPADDKLRLAEKNQRAQPARRRSGKTPEKGQGGLRGQGTHRRAQPAAQDHHRRQHAPHRGSEPAQLPDCRLRPVHRPAGLRDHGSRCHGLRGKGRGLRGR